MELGIWAANMLRDQAIDHIYCMHAGVSNLFYAVFYYSVQCAALLQFYTQARLESSLMYMHGLCVTYQPVQRWAFGVQAHHT